MIAVEAEERRLRLEGHAGFAPAGEDIVCAAASALVYALMATLEDRGLLAAAEVRGGYGEVVGKGACEREFYMARRGLALLAERFPECVRLEEKRDGEREDGLQSAADADAAAAAERGD